MGCCASTANPTSLVSPPVCDPLQGASRDTSQVSVGPPPNTDTVKQSQAPLPSSNGSSRPAHDLAVHNVEMTVQTQTQAHPLPDAQLSQSPKNHDTARLPQPPPVAVPAPPSTHNEGTRVSSPAQPKIDIQIPNDNNTIEQGMRPLHTGLFPSKSQCPHNLCLSPDYLHLRHTTWPGICLRPDLRPAPDPGTGHEYIPQLLKGQTRHRSRVVMATNSSLPHVLYFLTRTGMRPDYLVTNNRHNYSQTQNARRWKGAR